MKFRLEWKYQLKGSEPIGFSSDWLEGEIALRLGEDLNKLGKATNILFTDEMGTDWNLKEMKKLLSEIEDEPDEIVVYFDGGFNRDSNEAGLGVAIYYQQGKKKYRVRANERISEMDDNNEAEYAAFHFSLGLLEELEVRNVPCVFKGDSQVVLKQLEGEWPCYEENLNRWLDRIEQRLKVMGLVPRYVPISRKENKEADQLANQALEGKSINAKKQVL